MPPELSKIDSIMNSLREVLSYGRVALDAVGNLFIKVFELLIKAIEYIQNL